MTTILHIFLMLHIFLHFTNRIIISTEEFSLVLVNIWDIHISFYISWYWRCIKLRHVWRHTRPTLQDRRDPWSSWGCHHKRLPGPTRTIEAYVSGTSPQQPAKYGLKHGKKKVAPLNRILKLTFQWSLNSSWMYLLVIQHSCGKSQFLTGKSTINCDFQ